MSQLRAVVAATPMTDGRTRTVHLITDAEVAAGRTRGRYVAICDATVIAASLTTPDGQICGSCTSLINSSTSRHRDNE